MRIYKLAWKFTKGGTYTCALCMSPLHVMDIVNNPNHHFNPGQLYECSCGKSKVWTNSIRYPEELIDWCDNKEVPYHHDPLTYGFCNDEYCPYCWKHWVCLENGYRHQGVYYDRYGCNVCLKNQFALMEVNAKLGELDGQQYLAQWYKSHQDMWRNEI